MRRVFSALIAHLLRVLIVLILEYDLMVKGTVALKVVLFEPWYKLSFGYGG